MMYNFYARIASLSVGSKIGLIIGFLLLPIGHLTALFAQQVNKDISFSSLEITGAKLLGDVWPALSLSTQGQISPEGRAQAVLALRDRAEELKAADATHAFGQALATPARSEDIWAAGQTAIQKIADGSNLTLDPDVDTYYVMDVITVRLPELAAARGGLQKAVTPYGQSQASGDPKRHDNLVQAATRYEIALAAVRSSLAAAKAGNANGSLAATLDPAILRFEETSQALSVQAAGLRDVLAQSRIAQLSLSDSEAKATAFDQAADTLWRTAQSELIRLIEIRVEGFKRKAITDLLIAALGAVLALAVALVFVRSIRGPIGDLIATLRRQQTNDYSQPVPHIGMANELGEIARAIERGKAEAERSALTVSAMNQSPTMLMITDPDENISFISASLVELLMKLEPVFRAVKNDFAVERMIGQHLDYYRTNPNLSRKLLLDDGVTRKVRYDIRDETIMIDMAYIYAIDGSKIGHTLIWRNVTAELLGEAEVAAVVGAAQQGDFSARLPLENKEGFVRDVAAGLNQVSQVVEQATREFSQVMDAVAAGDLTRLVDGDYAGVLGSLKTSINETVDRLSQTVRTIQLTSADVGLAAREINMGADDLSKRTEEQASSLEETAATTEELAASVKASAQASREAAAIADEAKQAALAGGAIAGQAVDAMARIESASQKISDIIRVIDDIAFQTNLLALNAAVEAARAGDAGKGFAVVASEVRTLAQRSGEAAKDISALISSSNLEVGEGVKLVRQAGESLERILAASQKVAATIADISSASGEQANGIDEMSQAVAHLDEMTQANAALAEQSAASAGALSERIGQLNDLVAAFRTAPDGALRHGTALAATEPARLRQLAETAFAKGPARAQMQRPDPARPQVAAAALAKNVGNSRAGGSGWEEF